MRNRDFADECDCFYCQFDDDNIVIIYKQDIESMRDMALFYIKNGTKNEKKLANKLLNAVEWIISTPQYQKAE